MHFVVWAPDKADAVERRMDVRPRHLEYWGNSDLRVLVAGPMLDEATGEPKGSMLVVEADDIAVVRASMDADPYRTEGVFETVDVRPIKFTLGELAPQLNKGD
ncbi:MAG: YciI family protein [Proteobacteria bacterium]|jgi:uncharacterized protein|nr:YciI family protein [Pseudomonadota bacterium]